MVKQTISKRVKRITARQIVTTSTIAIVVIGLAVSTAYFAHAFHKEKHRKYNFEQVVQSMHNKTPSGSEYNLGSLGVHIVNDKVTPRKDATTDSIRAFLQKEVDASGCVNGGSIVNVAAYSTDETQLLLSYGCGSTTGALMYAIKKDDTWQTISPTNEFNELSIPSCEMVNRHNISSQIAPVCWTRSDDSEAWHYTYSLR